MEQRLIKLQRILIWSGISGIVLMLGVVGTYYHHFSGKILCDQDKWGQFGDFIGGTLNPIYSLFAYLGLLATIAITYRGNVYLQKENERQNIIDKRDEIFKTVANISTKIDTFVEKDIKLPDPLDSYKIKFVAFEEFIVSNFDEEDGWRVAEANQLYLKRLCAMIEFFNITLSNYRSLDNTEHVYNYYKSLYTDAVQFLGKYHTLPKDA